MKSILASGLVLLLLISSSRAAPPTLKAGIADSDHTITCIRESDLLLMNVTEAAQGFGWTVKHIASSNPVSDPGMLTLCQEKADGLCVPIQLAGTPHKLDGETIFVDATALAKAMRFSVVDKGNNIKLSALTKGDVDLEADLPAYNAAWGEGRGFRTGQTVPDIPLYDLDGKEVRFSSFLGKRYVLYCWASW